jgi:SRSO17 transposase
MFKTARVHPILAEFCAPVRSKFYRREAFEHFMIYVMALIASGWKSTVTGLSRAVGFGPHRSRRNAFLTEAQWDEIEVAAFLAWRKLRHLGLKAGEILYLILDDTHTRKRGKKMQGAGKFYDTVTMSYAWGHNLLKAVFWYKGFTIPLRFSLYLKPEQARLLNEAFRTLPELAAEIIRSITPPPGVRIVALFDSAYMNKKVVRALREKGFDYVSRLPSNRNVTIRGRTRKIATLLRSIPRREFRRVTVKKGDRTKRFWATDREAYIPAIGPVKLVFSRRAKFEHPIAVVTNRRDWSRREVLTALSLRWAIERFFEDAKQLLGLGEYQTGHWRGVRRHAHLVAVAYLFLVHYETLGMGATNGKADAAAGFSTMRARDRFRGALFRDLLDALQESAEPKRVLKNLLARVEGAAA